MSRIKLAVTFLQPKNLSKAEPFALVMYDTQVKVNLELAKALALNKCTGVVVEDVMTGSEDFKSLGKVHITMDEDELMTEFVGGLTLCGFKFVPVHDEDAEWKTKVFSILKEAPVEIAEVVVDTK